MITTMTQLFIICLIFEIVVFYAKPEVPEFLLKLLHAATLIFFILWMFQLVQQFVL